MTRDAGFITSHPPAGPVIGYSRAHDSLRRRARVGDRYFLFLCLVLLGYALGGRGFAYWGVNPLFIGEATLLIGVGVLLATGTVGRALSQRAMVPLMVFMFWGALNTLPYIDKYGRDAIRDAVVWGYGAFAFIISALLIADPTRLQRLVLYYRKFVYLFLLLAPVTWAVCNYAIQYVPPFPGGGVPLIQIKGGDMCVHLGGVYSYIVVLGAGIHPLLGPVLVPLSLGLNFVGRGGLVAFGSAMLVTMCFRPFHPRALRILFVVAMMLFVFWASELRFERGARELSFKGLVQTLSSIFRDTDEEALRGSKEWRMQWWRDIVNYTFRGKYFWTGKGFGINLATEDGHQVEADEALRSPHNGHLTILARAGVPGLALWMLVQGTWVAAMVRGCLVARKRRLTNWAALFIFLLAYWAALIANATFDVCIEGPMGGIWLWCIYGTGVAAAHLFRRYPDLLTPPPPAPLVAPAR